MKLAHLDRQWSEDRLNFAEIFRNIVFILRKTEVETQLSTPNFRNANHPHPVPRTPQSGAENLGVEFLLVLANLWGVAVRSNVGRVDVDHGALPVVLSFDWLAFTARCRGSKREKQTGTSGRFPKQL